VILLYGLATEGGLSSENQKSISGLGGPYLVPEERESRLVRVKGNEKMKTGAAEPGTGLKSIKKALRQAGTGPKKRRESRKVKKYSGDRGRNEGSDGRLSAEKTVSGGNGTLSTFEGSKAQTRTPAHAGADK